MGVLSITDLLVSTVVEPTCTACKCLNKRTELQIIWFWPGLVAATQAGTFEVRPPGICRLIAFGAPRGRANGVPRMARRSKHHFNVRLLQLPLDFLPFLMLRENKISQRPDITSRLSKLYHNKDKTREQEITVALDQLTILYHMRHCDTIDGGNICDMFRSKYLQRHY